MTKNICYCDRSNKIYAFTELCTSAHDDSITCPLEVSELENEPLENELSDTETKHPVSIYDIFATHTKDSHLYP